MGKKKKKGGGGGGGGGGSGGGGGDGGGGGFNKTGDGQCFTTTPFSPTPDQIDQAPCGTDNTDHGNSDQTVSGSEVNTGKGGKGGGKDGGAFLTALFQVDFHCDGCEAKIRASITGFKGVEGVKMDRGANRVTVVGTMDPWKLRDKIQKKTKKKVEVISPAQKKQGGGYKQNASGNSNCNQKEKQRDNSKEANQDSCSHKEEGKKDDNNSCNQKEEGKKGDNKQVLVVNTMVLKVMLHCDGCIMRIRGVLMKIKGVEQVAMDAQKNQITVKGTMKTKGFAEFLAKKIKRHVELVGQKEQKERENQQEKEKEKKEKEKGCAGQMTCHADTGWCHCDKCGYHVYMVPAPQLFSDENPNACAVM